MSYYKLSVIREVLHRDFGARCTSVVEPNAQVWSRNVGGHTCIAIIRQRGAHLTLFEGELYFVAQALRIDVRELQQRVKERGGLWLGPDPY